MIVLDTNVVCGPLKPKPDAAGLAWLDRQAPETLYLTAITLAELQAGSKYCRLGNVARRCRQRRQKWSPSLRTASFHSIRTMRRCLGVCLRTRKQWVIRFSFGDCAIAAITLRGGYVLATRNVRDYKGAGIELINPWDGR